MSENQENQHTEAVVLSKKKDLPLVWLLPLIALIISAWLIYKSDSEKGAVITIDFLTAEGLEVDKTKIRYLDVEIGKVTTISINDDAKTIRVTAQMTSTANKYLTEKSNFWVVRPQVGLSGVSGLNTLFSGSYIALKPGGGERKLHFKGLSSTPVLKSYREGKQFILKTDNLGSLHPGTQISFHDIPVGEVLSDKLSDDSNSILLTIFIYAPYDRFIRKNTRFWINSGIDLSAGADGFKLRTGPLLSLLSGGIAFRTSPHDHEKDIQPEYSKFILYSNYEESNQINYNNSLKYVMYFNGSVRGLTEGAPVQLRGIPIGRVVDISLELDKKTAELRIPVVVELKPDQIQVVHEEVKVSHEDIIEQLVNKGLRAQLQMGSLVTGQLLIDLDFHPRSKKRLTKDSHSIYPEFPTTASSLEEITHSAQVVMDKLAKLPLDKLTEDMDKSLAVMQVTSEAATAMLKNTDQTIASLNKALSSADATMHSAHQVLSSIEPGSNGYYEFHKMLQEFSWAARSARQLTDYLERHPESLLRGKEDE